METQSNSFEISLSSLDEERFGVRTARVEWMNEESLPHALDFCRREGVRLLIANCVSAERATVQAMEREGFELMDTIVCFEKDLTKPLPAPGEVVVRTARPGEEERLAEVAARAFRGYVSHYHADPRLDRARVEEVYPDWVRRWTLGRDGTSEVIVSEHEGAVTGFVLMRVHGNDETISPLAGVLPEHRRSRAIHSLAVRVFEWSVALGAKRTFAMIQLDNLPMQRAMIKMGFEPLRSHFTLHKWFDR